MAYSSDLTIGTNCYQPEKAASQLQPCQNCNRMFLTFSVIELSTMHSLLNEILDELLNVSGCLCAYVGVCGEAYICVVNICDLIVSWSTSWLWFLIIIFLWFLIAKWRVNKGHSDCHRRKNVVCPSNTHTCTKFSMHYTCIHITYSCSRLYIGTMSWRPLKDHCRHFLGRPCWDRSEPSGVSHPVFWQRFCPLQLCVTCSGIMAGLLLVWYFGVIALSEQKSERLV